uniref:Uncharacterized protein n=1 Tax=viral metagenome TaxID=1070528 RepID=A0A6C0CAG0_9ZZZZ
MICKSPANLNLCGNIAFNIQDPLNMICKSPAKIRFAATLRSTFKIH